MVSLSSFFLDPLVEAAVAGLHVENRDLPALGRDHRKTAVGVAVKQERFGFFAFHDRVGARYHVADGLGGTRAYRIEKNIRFSQSEILEEHLVKFVIEILSGMHEYMLGEFVQFLDHHAQLDDLGSGADDCHDLAHNLSPINNLPVSSTRILSTRICVASITPASSAFSDIH